MKVYLKNGKTTFEGKELTDKQVHHLIYNFGEVYLDPETVRNGTVDLDELPKGVIVHFTPTPPEDALVLLPSPRGWRIKE